MSLATLSQLSQQILLPSQKVVLTVTCNKMQLRDTICKQLVNVNQQLHTSDIHKLVVTGQDEVPIEVHMGIMTKYQDLHITRGGIIHQMCELAICITVVYDDTDVSFF